MSGPEARIPLSEERLSVKKREVVRGKVRIRTETDFVQELADLELSEDEVEIVRHPVGRPVDEPPAMRTEGSVLIIPVLEEVMVVEKRLMLKEELHISRRVTNRTQETPVTLRKQRAVVDRLASPNQEDSEMSDISSTQRRTVTAFFDERDDAEEAVSRLAEAGVPRASITLVPGSEGDGQDRTEDHKGFFESLADFFMPDEDRYSYAEGLRRGGYVVTVAGLTEDLHDRALDILDDEGSIDLDEREATWRSEGWTGYEGTTEAMPAAGAAGAMQTDSGRMESGQAEETIPIAEEQLRVGKRDVNLGRVRVRSYVVEEPVNESVDLSEERVIVDRRPVDRELTGSDSAFQDRVIEAEEHSEEPVIEKSARITEEIGLRKERDTHTENVSDTVRHTKVEVEDEREANRQKSGTQPDR